MDWEEGAQTWRWESIVIVRGIFAAWLVDVDSAAAVVEIAVGVSREDGDDKRKVSAAVWRSGFVRCMVKMISIDMISMI